jgi:hypothetical protein
MDILYYSNYCSHSQKIVQFVAKNNLASKLNCICIDKRTRDPQSNQVYILLENGKQVVIPPNIHSVPALLLVKQNYKVIFGDEILAVFGSTVKTQNDIATNSQGEPMGFHIPSSNNGMSIVSEKYTLFDMEPNELSAKGNGKRRQLYDYVSADQDNSTIYTPDDKYKPDKISNSVTIESLSQKRNEAFGSNTMNSLI